MGMRLTTASVVVPGLVTAEVVHHVVRVFCSQAAEGVALAHNGFAFLEVVGDPRARMQGFEMLTELAQLRADRCPGTCAERTDLWRVAALFHVAQHQRGRILWAFSLQCSRAAIKGACCCWKSMYCWLLRRDAFTSFVEFLSGHLQDKGNRGHIWSWKATAESDLRCR